ncbi:MAG: PD40 domain-containing protein [Pyrinomonadaceae bacterium]|nr:PD40 domain-containing protein [Pyrinomonadaceae bacterium]
MTPHTRLIATSLSILAALCVLGLVVTVRSQTGASQLRRITNTSDGRINLNPSMSGDGQHLVFESTNDIAGVGGPPRIRAIRANIASTPPTFAQVGTTRAHAAAISQDGSRISFASTDDPLGINPDNNSEIFILDGVPLTNKWQQMPLIG